MIICQYVMVLDIFLSISTTAGANLVLAPTQACNHGVQGGVVLLLG